MGRLYRLTRGGGVERGGVGPGDEVIIYFISHTPPNTSALLSLA